MLKKVLIATLILMLCSLLLLIPVGTAQAAEEGYERISYSTNVLPTIDGEWTEDEEWTDIEVTMIGEDVAFGSTWDMGDDVMTRWIVEFLSDTTDDEGDYWQMCMDGNADGGDAPQADDFKFEITNNVDLVWYQGDGTGWTEITLDETEMEWASSLSESPTNSTPHWILEFQIPKNSLTVLLTIIWNFRLAVYDAGGAAEVLAWPPTDPDVPNEWGIENYTQDQIPEGLTFAVMVLLSSVSLLVGSQYLRKRSKKQEK